MDNSLGKVQHALKWELSSISCLPEVTTAPYSVRRFHSVEYPVLGPSVQEGCQGTVQGPVKIYENGQSLSWLLQGVLRDRGWSFPH